MKSLSGQIFLYASRYTLIDESFVQGDYDEDSFLTSRVWERCENDRH